MKKKRIIIGILIGALVSIGGCKHTNDSTNKSNGVFQRENKDTTEIKEVDDFNWILSPGDVDLVEDFGGLYVSYKKENGERSLIDLSGEMDLEGKDFLLDAAGCTEQGFVNGWITLYDTNQKKYISDMEGNVILSADDYQDIMLTEHGAFVIDSDDILMFIDKNGEREDLGRKERISCKRNDYGEIEYYYCRDEVAFDSSGKRIDVSQREQEIYDKLSTCFDYDDIGYEVIRWLPDMDRVIFFLPEEDDDTYDGKLGIGDFKGNVILEPEEYLYSEMDDGYQLRKNHYFKYGLIKARKRITPDQETPWDDIRYCYLDLNGDIVLDLEDAVRALDYEEGYAVYLNEKKHLVLIDTEGKEILDIHPDIVNNMGAISVRTLMVETSDGWGVARLK